MNAESGTRRPPTRDEILTGIRQLLSAEKIVVARIIERLVDVEDMGLHVGPTSTSLTQFCRRELGMSKGEASARVKAATAVRRVPALLDALHSNIISLTNLVVLGDVFTPENVDEVLALAYGKTKREVQQLARARSGKRPTMPTLLRRLPTVTPAGIGVKPAAQRPSAVEDSAPASQNDGTRPSAASAGPSFASNDEPARTSERPDCIVPLCEELYRLHQTIDQELHDLMMRACVLMQDSNPKGDLLVCTKAAFRSLLERLEVQATPAPPDVALHTADVVRPEVSLGITKTHEASVFPDPSAATTAAECMSRAVVEPDGQRCTTAAEAGPEVERRGRSPGARDETTLGAVYDGRRDRTKGHVRPAASKKPAAERLARAARRTQRPSRKMNTSAESVERSSLTRRIVDALVALIGNRTREDQPIG